MRPQIDPRRQAGSPLGRGKVILALFAAALVLGASPGVGGTRGTPFAAILRLSSPEASVAARAASLAPPAADRTNEDGLAAEFRPAAPIHASHGTGRKAGAVLPDEAIAESTPAPNPAGTVNDLELARPPIPRWWAYASPVPSLLSQGLVTQLFPIRAPPR